MSDDEMQLQNRMQYSVIYCNNCNAMQLYSAKNAMQQINISKQVWNSRCEIYFLAL